MSALSDGEWAVLEVLWKGDCFQLGAVYHALQDATKWSRNTVHTYLTRMEGKGLVSIDRSCDPHRYRAQISRADCQQQERKVLLDKVYKGDTGDLIVAFLKEHHISPQERDRLRSLLDEMEV